VSCCADGVQLGEQQPGARGDVDPGPSVAADCEESPGCGLSVVTARVKLGGTSRRPVPRSGGGGSNTNQEGDGPGPTGALPPRLPSRAVVDVGRRLGHRFVEELEG
jgi:hypothetical protein